MLENCIHDDLQEIKFLEALVHGKTQIIFYINNLKIHTAIIKNNTSKSK